MMPCYDAWAIRRQLGGHQLGAGLRLVSGRFRALAEELEATARPGRGRAYRLALSLLGPKEQLEIKLRVIDADPDGPPPATDQPDAGETTNHTSPAARGGHRS